MRSYGAFRGAGHQPFTSGMPSPDYHNPSSGDTGAGHTPDSPYPTMLEADTYDPISAEYEDGLPNYEQPEPWHELAIASTAPLRPPPLVHFEQPQPPEYGSPADQLLTEWCINQAWEELLDLSESEPVSGNIDAVTQPTHTDDSLYGCGNAELLQPSREASVVLGDTLDRCVEEALDVGRPAVDESFEAAHPCADDPRFRSSLEDVVEQEMQRFENPYGPIDPPAMSEMTSPGLGFTGPEASLPW